MFPSQSSITVNKTKQMSIRLSETIASLHETRSVDLEEVGIDAEGATALADVLKTNTSVTKIDLQGN